VLVNLALDFFNSSSLTFISDKYCFCYLIQKFERCDTQHYLLEKTRIVQAGPRERSFHVFYQVGMGIYINDDESSLANSLLMMTVDYLLFALFISFGQPALLLCANINKLWILNALAAHVLAVCRSRKGFEPRPPRL
jgi:hypothetical protein